MSFELQSMAIQMPRIVHAKQILGHIFPIPSASDVPRGHFAVYVGENKKRFVIPWSCLKSPSFQNLLSQAEEEFGFNHPKGILTIRCNEEIFTALTSHLNS